MTPTEPTGFGFVEAPSTDLDTIAVQWHAMSDHGRDGTPLGGYLCNCERVAVRVAVFVGAVTAERDRARDTAVRLEQELAEVRETCGLLLNEYRADHGHMSGTLGTSMERLGLLKHDRRMPDRTCLTCCLIAIAENALDDGLAQSPTDTPQGAQIGAGGLTEGNEGELLRQNWEVFRSHRPVGAYLPVGQMDGDCHACGTEWPCESVMEVVEPRGEVDV